MRQNEDCDPDRAPQILLRNCSKEVVGKDSIYVILVKGEYRKSSTNFFFFVGSFCLSHEVSASPKKQSPP